MARAGDKKKDRVVRLDIAAEILDAEEGERVPELAVYVFDGGRLLAREDLERGTGTVRVTGRGELRVLVGPKVPADDHGELLATLVRIGAVESMVTTVDAVKLAVPIDRVLWPCWLRLCTVQGTLHKRVTVSGTAVELPVCDAEVEIYRVEPLHIIIPRVPDLVIGRLRDVLRKPPWPPGPDPGPWLPHVPTGPREVYAARPEPAVPPEGAVGDFQFTTAEQGEATPGEITATLAEAAADERMVRAAHAGTDELRRALIAAPELTTRLLCFLWPPAVTVEKIATVTTDRCGHFRTRVINHCGDGLNLYFKAYKRFGWLRLPLLTPTPIACHTRWDYRCGTEVTLHTTSPFALPCAPCSPVIAPAYSVVLLGVGDISAARIRGVAGPAAGADIGLTDMGEPWGGNLHIRLDFDPRIPGDLNVPFYRVSYRRVASSNQFRALDSDELRHRAHPVGPDLVYEAYPLNTSAGSTADLYKIPPALDPPDWWGMPDPVVDTSNATFTAALAPGADAGLYEFRIELFDASGARVDPAAHGIGFRIPTTTDLHTTVHTAPARPGMVVDGGLVFTLHIDNNVCTGELGAPTLDGVPAGAECGVLSHGPGGGTVAMPFTASHPNGFATYSFGVVRGATGVYAESAPVGVPPGAHNPTASTAALLGPCAIAGFAENLHVAATATDGWGRRYDLDAPERLRAFVLNPRA